MHLSINKKRIYFYIICLFLITSITNQEILSNFKKLFLIKKININLDKPELNNKILLNLNYLIDKNILFLNKKNFLTKISSINYLENIKIEKNYPSTIIFSANKTKLLASTFINQKKYYIGENNQFILAGDINISKNLPTIFGKFNISEFIDLQNELNNQNIDQSSILKYFFHKNKRWDLYYPNNKIIMLPNKNITEAITLYKKFETENKIGPDTIIDLRIENRLVLTNG